MTKIWKMGISPDNFISDTQDLNKKALATFSRYGLEPQTPEYVYHLWRKK